MEAPEDLVAQIEEVDEPAASSDKVAEKAESAEDKVPRCMHPVARCLTL